MNGVNTLPFTQAKAITKSDTDNVVLPKGVDPTPGTRWADAIYVGGAGDITVLMPNGDSIAFKAVPVGTLLPVQVKRVMSTGTTATDLVGLWRI